MGSTEIRIIFLRKYVVSLLMVLMVSVGAIFPMRASATTAQPKLQVIVSILPLKSLVDMVLGDIATSTSLLRPDVSPHDQRLRPSDMRKLINADVVFWVGPGLERPFIKPIENLPSSVLVVSVNNIKDLRRLRVRVGGFGKILEIEASRNTAEINKDISELDPHVWLDPKNAEIIIAMINETMQKIDPKHRDGYARNAEKALQTITEMGRDISKILEPVQGRPFVVYHDAFQYFERQYGLENIGSLTDANENPLGLASLLELRRKMKRNNVQCLLQEPGPEVPLVKVLRRENSVKTGILDVMGSMIKQDQEKAILYPLLMKGMAKSFRKCLSFEE